MKVPWLIAIFLTPTFSAAAPQVVVGSKIFTESYILSEIAAETLEKEPGVKVQRKMGMGNTGILFESLKNGAIDVSPDYSGTLAETLLKEPGLRRLSEIRARLAPLGLTISESLGFDNSYALATREDFAEKNGLHSISDLVTLKSPVRLAFSYEFMERADGFRGLVQRYQLPYTADQVSRMEHSLVYQAIADGAVDVIEVYSTDANIQKFGLRLLQDDREYFPSYQAVWVARTAFVDKNPELWRALRTVEGRISEEKMRSMNAEADLRKQSFSKVTADFLGQADGKTESRAKQIVDRTKEHLWLVGISLLFSILVGIPLGVATTKFFRLGQVILVFAALMQTIPTLALLCFLIPLFGIGLKPALVALCLYSLLPVILNTRTGIESIDAKHFENAKAFGLNARQILFHITLPIASPMILTGLKTATIVSIGTATLAALVGAGGYGALIVSGLSLNNTPTILMGAVPAALMAFAAHFLFEGLNLILVPKVLRKTAN